MPPAIYIYEKYYFRIFSLVMAILAFAFLVYSEFIGASISVILGVLLSFSYQGVKIDQGKRQLIKYDRFLWLKIGRWEAMSTPSYVTVVRINLSSRRSVPSPMVLPEDKKGAKAYKVNLVVEGDERYISICRGSFDKMTSEALRLGKYLNIRVLDYTTHDKKWIL